LATPAFTLREIVQRLGGQAVGEAREPLTGVAPLDTAGPAQIAFLANPKYRSKLASTNAGAVIIGPADRDATERPRIVADNPYAYYARTVALFVPPRVAAPGRHASAQVEAGATVAASAEIGPFVSIEAGAVVGERVRIGAGSVVGAGARIGDDSLLHARVTIYAKCVIGARAVLHSGCVIGADGFGMANDRGTWVKIPQVGRVVIGDDVEVGANTTIDRGALEDTVIEEGVKLDNLIMIAHNCRIGAHTVIAGCTGISGSTTVGRHCVIGGGVGLVGHIAICDGTTISGFTLITKSITKPGVYTSGLPFMAHADWLRNAAQLRHLDEIAAAVRRNKGEHRGPDDD
jgi:UDP-3-O-[3-hydroxymyristoyl] glucosamine N-acyltransferase